MTKEMSRSFLRLFAVSIPGILLLLSGCGGTTITGTKPIPTVTMSASPTTVASGASSTLTVSATNASTVVVTGTDGSSYTLSASGGTQAVSPKTTTTYTATASGVSGTTPATATATVTISTPVVQPTVTISAAPTTILAGASSTLTVAATNATAVTIAGSDGSSYTLSAATGGTQSVTPSKTTTYTVTATGASGTTPATAMATVTVNPNPNAPTVTISASPTTVVVGSSSTLTVTATKATGITIAGSDGSSYTVTNLAGGTQSVTPSATTTYTVTATGAGGTSATATATVTVTPPPAPTVTVTAAPATIYAGSNSVLTVTATNAMAVTLSGNGSSYTLAATGGAETVTPGPTDTTATTYTYTATATGGTGTTPATAMVTVTVNPSATAQESVKHVIFMLQENHSFDNYFGMLNPYRESPNGKGQACPDNGSGVAQCWNIGDDGVEYNVDGIDNQTFSSPDDAGANIPLFPLETTCIDDESSDWLSSYGDVNRYDFTTGRKIQENGFVHTAGGYATSCASDPNCSGDFSDTTGVRSMGYYTQNTLNYYYYMASQFALSDRWFSPVASKSIDNRIATFSGGTTQGLTRDPGGDDDLSQLALPVIFRELDAAKVSWKIYYTVTKGFCKAGADEVDDCVPPGTSGGPSDQYPATDFSSFTYSFNYLQEMPTGGCSTIPESPAGTFLQGSNNAITNDSTNSFCVDPAHIAPLPQYYVDLQNGALPQFTFIEAGYATNDEHPGAGKMADTGQSILQGQYEMSQILNQFMTSTSYANSVFFFAYDEGGGPFDHVPPVPTFTNKYTIFPVGAATASDYPDIGTISVNPDGPGTPETNPYFPCAEPDPGTATLHCDLTSGDPGFDGTDAPNVYGFGAQLGFRLPNIVISPFSRRHYVSHIPMDHTAVIRFVEDLFIGNHQYLTGRDAVQPNLLNFFDFNNIPWATPPTPPTPVVQSNSPYACNAANLPAPPQ